MITPAKRLTHLALLAACILAIGSALSPAGSLAAESATVSANWSGYAVTGASQATRFHRVAGTWVQPAGSCVPGQETYSVAWVGLGGFNRGSDALEQTGTAVDCTYSGRPVYSAWYELVPAAPVTLKLGVRPGDVIAGSVSQKARRIIMQVRDLTSHATRTVVRTVSAPDLSSAEWIVEAPSICLTSRHCTPLPLTDFGTVPFSNASTTTTRTKRTAIDTASLKVTRLELRDYSQNETGQRMNAAFTPATGIASELSATGNAFTVTWQALSSKGSEEQQQPQPQSNLTSEAASVRR